jgi:hypothetical protein
MKKIHEFYALGDEKVRQLVTLLPWKHNLLLMSLVRENGLSRNKQVLTSAISFLNYRKEAKAYGDKASKISLENMLHSTNWINK